MPLLKSVSGWAALAEAYRQFQQLHNPGEVSTTYKGENFTKTTTRRDSCLGGGAVRGATIAGLAMYAKWALKDDFDGIVGRYGTAFRDYITAKLGARHEEAPAINRQSIEDYVEQLPHSPSQPPIALHFQSPLPDIPTHQDEFGGGE